MSLPLLLPHTDLSVIIKQKELSQTNPSGELHLFLGFGVVLWLFYFEEILQFERKVPIHYMKRKRNFMAPRSHKTSANRCNRSGCFFALLKSLSRNSTPCLSMLDLAIHWVGPLNLLSFPRRLPHTCLRLQTTTNPLWLWHLWSLPCGSLHGISQPGRVFSSLGSGR